MKMTDMKKNSEKVKKQIKKMRMRKVVSLFMLLNMLAGCADMNSQFDCPMKPGVRCESLDHINAKIDRGEIGREDKEKVAVSIVANRHFQNNNNNKNRSSYLQPVRQTENKKTFKDFNNQAKPNHDVSRHEPLRYGESVMRVWIAPFEDTVGNYHQESEVYSVIKPGHWIGNPVKVIESDEE